MKSKILEIRKEHEQFFLTNQIKLNRFLYALILIDSTLLSIFLQVKEFLRNKFRIFIFIIMWLGTYSIIANFIIFPVPKIISFITVSPILFFLAGFILFIFVDEDGVVPTGMKFMISILANFFSTISVLIALLLGFLLFYVIS